MSEEPFDVPAEGVVEYKYFTVDPGWTEDRWIKISEARPDNRAVVHHILVFAVPRGFKGDPQLYPNIGGFAPGAKVNLINRHRFVKGLLFGAPAHPVAIAPLVAVQVDND